MPFSLRAWVRSLAAPASTARRPARLRLEALEAKLVPTAYVVNTTLDLLNDTTGGQVTLRDALTAIDAQAASGDAAAGTASNTIAFAIGAAGSVQTIVVTSALPTLTHQTTIDGRTQGGANYAGPPLVVLNGANAGAAADGLAFFGAGSDGSSVRGLVVQQFGHNGILIDGASGIAVAGNFIGTDVAGTAKLGNGADGVLVIGAANDTIGGTSSGAGNLLSGNGGNGVEITAAGTSGNAVLGNFIGTDVAGTAKLGNARDGVKIDGAANDTIGGTASGAGNLVSGNGIVGVDLVGSAATGNAVLGNRIGTDANGTAKLGNAFNGVFVGFGAADNTLGGTSSGAGNVISGNTSFGVEIRDPGTTGNAVLGNFIGTDAHGTAALGNALDGVLVLGGGRTTRWAALRAGPATSSPATPPTASRSPTPARRATWCWATRSARTSTARPNSATPTTAC